MQRVGQYVGYLAIRVVICAAQAVSLETCQSAAWYAARLFHDVLRMRRRVTDENLRHAFPEMSPRQRHVLARAMWEHLFLFGAEVAQTGRKLRGGNWRKHIRVHGEPVLVRRMLERRPLVLVTAHYGNFELASYVLSLLGYPIYSVARTLDNPYLDHYVNTFRGSTGQTMLSKRGDYEKILDALESGGAVSFVADQYAGSKGCWVDFFNRPASAHKAIALFALDYNAPIIVGHCRRTGGPLEYELRMTATADPQLNEPHTRGIRELTQWYTTAFEAMIRESPQQYWWLHRRWKDNRPAKKRKRAEKKAA